MPIYEYQCTECGNRSEAMQRISDPPLTTCENCGGELKKLISAPAFQFKGSGWYVTDYADKKGKGEGKSEGGGSKDSSSKDDSGKSSSDTSSSSKSESTSSSKSDSSSKSS